MTRDVQPEPNPDVAVSTGARREEMRYEPGKGDRVRVTSLAKPEAALPRHERTTLSAGQPDKSGEPVEDVKVDTAASSVWDGRPPERRAFQDVPAGGAPQASPLTEGMAGDETATTAPEPSPLGGSAKPPFPPSELVSKRAGG